jgi:hypothetical protein
VGRASGDAKAGFWWVLGALAGAALLAACGTSGSGASPGTTAPSTHPSRTYHGPAGLLAIAPPQASGSMWLLAGTGTTRNLQSLNLASGAIGAIVPEASGASSLTQTSSGLLAVGIDGGTTGAVELHNGGTGALQGVVPLAGPVHSVAAGSDGTTVYALFSTPTAAAVAVVNTTTSTVVTTIPVASDAVDATVDPAQANLFVVESGGHVAQIDIANGQTVGRFPVGSSPSRAVVSSDGTTLYVLKGTGAVANVGVVKVATEGQTRALPAPADSVDLQLSPDDASLYLAVGTPTYGNVQVFSSDRA